MLSDSSSRIGGHIPSLSPCQIWFPLYFASIYIKEVLSLTEKVKNQYKLNNLSLSSVIFQFNALWVPTVCQALL